MIGRQAELRLSRASGGVSQPTYSTLQVVIPKQAGPLGQVLKHWMHEEKSPCWAAALDARAPC